MVCHPSSKASFRNLALLWRLVEGLEVFSSNFLLAIEEKNRQGLQRMF